MVVVILLERDVVIDTSNRCHVIKAFRTLTGLDLLESVRAIDGAIAIGYSTTATDRRRADAAAVGIHELKYGNVAYGRVVVLKRR